MAFVAGLLIFQISMSGSEETATDEGPIVEQAGTIDADNSAVRPQGVGAATAADSTSHGSSDIASLTADPGSSFYISFADSTGVSGETGDSIPAGQPTSAGSLSGTVVDVSSLAGKPLPRISVYLARADGVFTGATTMTGDDGRFHFEGLAPGAYKLYFFDLAGVWKAAWYGGPAVPAGVPVSIASGREAQVVQGLNRADPEDGAISGRVTDAAGNGVAGVDVLAYFVDEASGVLLLLKGSAVTDADGNYEVTGLPAAASASSGGGASHVTGYKVQFVPSGGIISSQWYDGQPTHLTAKLMQLKPAEKLFGIDAVLTGGGTISGRITLEGGEAAPSTLVDIFDASGVIIDTQITATDGTYQSDMLPAGTYHLRAVPRSSEYAMEWYDNGHDLASSAAIQVRAGNNTGGMDLALAKATPAPVAASEPSVGDAESRPPLEAALHEPGADGLVDTPAGSEVNEETGDVDAADGTEGGCTDQQTGSENAPVDQGNGGSRDGTGNGETVYQKEDSEKSELTF